MKRLTAATAINQLVVGTTEIPAYAMPLQLEHLGHSIDALSALMEVAEDDSRMSRFSETEQAGIIAGVVKNFEITYELSWKLIARWLDDNLTPGIADGVTKRHLYRLAAEQHLIQDVDRWMAHHRARNQTAHIYDHQGAMRVYLATREFVADARALYAVLEGRND